MERNIQDSLIVTTAPLRGRYSGRTPPPRQPTAITAAHAPLRDAVTAYRAACASLTPEAELLEILRATGSIVLSAEAIVAASKLLEATARAALAQAMAETGCPAVAGAAVRRVKAADRTGRQV
jgi:hypothetical protein